jgi:hypothetical protein
MWLWDFVGSLEVTSREGKLIYRARRTCHSQGGTVGGAPNRRLQPAMRVRDGSLAPASCVVYSDGG